MAIKKTDAIETAKQNHSAAIAELEKRIDRGISERYQPNGSLSCNVQGSSEFVINAIKERYIAAGWTVREDKGDCQREGSWHNLIFS